MTDAEKLGFKTFSIPLVSCKACIFSNKELNICCLNVIDIEKKSKKQSEKIDIMKYSIRCKKFKERNK